uniref:Protein PAT1 homolog 1 n=1 Tax=Takifugu rubripes TaxID=31033 RepID=H2RNJ2_TAKRU
MFRFQFIDEDCTLEEEEDGPVEDEDEIDQYNDDTFGAGAIDDDWQEEHKRLTELDEKDGLSLGGAGIRAESELGNVENSSNLPSSARGGDSQLADSLARIIQETDPAIAGVGAAERPFLSPRSSVSSLTGAILQGPGQPKVMVQTCSNEHSTQVNSHSIWENSMAFCPASITVGLGSCVEDSSPLSGFKETGLPKRLLQAGNDGQDLSERVPPPRSSSPVIGSPPVRVVPIGTPPKQPVSHTINHQIQHPLAVHVRAPGQHRFPPPYTERLSPNTLLNIANSPLCRGPFPPRVGPVLSQIQRAQILNPQVARFPCTGPAPPLLPGGGFRQFFGGSVPSGQRMASLPPRGLTSHGAAIRHNTTHLHPQHHRMLTQRMQNQAGRTGGDRRSRDPYSNLMTQKEKEWVTKVQMMQLQSTDPYLDDYYYQNYYEKMEKRQERQTDSSKKEHTTKLITPQIAKVEHSYRPVQFAGSLGKLTVSSVNNPRKMIDAVVTARSDDEEKREKQVWNKRRQILYTVEKIYSLLLEVQDFEKHFVQTSEEDREALLEQHKANTSQLCNSLLEKEWENRVSDEQCLMIMSVRKGKRLISRLLPFLPSQQAGAVIMAIARNLPVLAKKDKQDQVLCSLVEPVAAVIPSLSSSALIGLLQELQSSDGQLESILHNKFGVTLLYLILSEGERMQTLDPNCQLMEDNRWTELVFSVSRELLSIPSSSLSSPLFVPPNLQSLLSRYVDQQSLEYLHDKLQITPFSR